jgi:hypothetical protein
MQSGNKTERAIDTDVQTSISAKRSGESINLENTSFTTALTHNTTAWKGWFKRGNLLCPLHIEDKTIYIMCTKCRNVYHGVSSCKRQHIIMIQEE